MRLWPTYAVAETRWTWSDFAYPLARHAKRAPRWDSWPRTQIVIWFLPPLIWLVPWDSEAIAIVSARRWGLQTIRFNLAGGVAVSQLNAMAHCAPHASRVGDRSRPSVGAPEGTAEQAETTTVGESASSSPLYAESRSQRK